MTEARYCTNCGAKLGAQASVCPSCGALVEPKAKTKPLRMVLLIIVGVVVFIFAGALGDALSFKMGFAGTPISTLMFAIFSIGGAIGAVVAVKRLTK